MHKTHNEIFRSTQRDLPLPSTPLETQHLYHILKPGSSPLLPLQVPQQLLPLVHQKPQVALVHLVHLPSTVQKLTQRPNPRRQDRDLHLAAPRVRARSRRFVRERALGCLFGEEGSRWGGLRRQVRVGVVAAESGDAALDVDMKAILGGGIGEGGDSADRFRGGDVVRTVGIRVHHVFLGREVLSLLVLRHDVLAALLVACP